MRTPLAVVLAILALGLVSTVPAAGAPPCDRRPDHPKCQPGPSPSPTRTPAPSIPGAGPRLTFGLGSQADVAIDAALTLASPIHLLSSWYNGPADLAWMTDAYHRGEYADAAAQGYSLHLITWTNVPETSIATPYGTACGRAYPLSDRWLEDMRAIAEAMRPAFVTLFTEFQTYTCTDNRWAGNEPYWRALIDQFDRGAAVFRAVGAKVSIGWGGWQTQTDRSLEPAFLALDEDVRSFQAMHGVSNVAASRAMTELLGATGIPVMQAHHMPDADTNDLATVYRVFAEDVAALFGSDASVQALVDDGLFAWSFVDDKPMRADPDTFALVRDVVIRYGR